MPAGLVPGLDAPPISIAFGSQYAGPQFATWIAGTRIGAALAADVLLFDAIIQNFDRRTNNPNCLVRGDEIRLIDHEAAFIYGQDRGVIGWQPPWALGGMQPLVNGERHIFYPSVRLDVLVEAEIEAAWRGIDESNLQSYREALPQEFRDDIAVMTEVERAISLIRDARDHIGECLAEFKRVMK